MVDKQWLRVENGPGTIHITKDGRHSYVVVLALDGRIANRALSGFSDGEVVELCSYLKRVIANTGAGTPDVWTHPGPGAGTGTAAAGPTIGASTP
jgi:hypothetical protein